MKARTGLALDTGMATAEVGKLVKKAERYKFDSIWISEDPYFRDSVATLSMVALQTRKIDVAACIMNMFSRNPVYMAMAAATLDELAGGRFILGLGRGISSVMEDELHVKYGSHITYALEYLKCVRGLLRGERVTFQGREIVLTGSKLRFPVLRKEIPLLLAAMGPKMLKVAAKAADGAIMNCATSVRHTDLAIKTMKSAGLSSPRVACYLWTNIDEDQDRAYDFARTRIGYILSVPSFGEVILSSSHLPSDFLPALRKIYMWDKSIGDPIWHLEQGIAKDIKHLVSDDVVDALSVCGPVEHCRKRVREYLKVGVTDAIVGPMNPATYAKAHLLVGA